MPRTTEIGEEVRWRRLPIWETQGTKFKPYSITTVILFYVGKFFGWLFGKER